MKMITKKQAQILDFIRAQLNVDLTANAYFVKRAVIGVYVPDFSARQQMKLVESLAATSGKFEVVPGGASKVNFVIPS